MKDNKIQILKVIVGSQAHGLATPESDFDYRGVFIYKTSEILGLHSPKDQTNWIEGKEDDTSWELGKFLLMATKCNPTVLETFKSPAVPFKDPTYESRFSPNGKYADELRNLFQHVWNSTDVKNAYIGYGVNQRKKFLEDKDKRKAKYAVAYLRSLYNGWEILTRGDFSVDMTPTPIYETLKKWKAGVFTAGEVIDLAELWTEKVNEAYDKNPKKETYEEPVNNFLLKVRQENWE